MLHLAERGMLERVSAQLALDRELVEQRAMVSLDSTIIKLHPDAAGAPKREVVGDRALVRERDDQADPLARDDRGTFDARALAQPSARRPGPHEGEPVLLVDRAY